MGYGGGDGEMVEKRDQKMVEKERGRDGEKEILGGIMERRRMANARKYGDDGEEGMEEEER